MTDDLAFARGFWNVARLYLWVPACLFWLGC